MSLDDGGNLVVGELVKRTGGWMLACIQSRLVIQVQSCPSQHHRLLHRTRHIDVGCFPTGV